ncbi:hypothetical protein AVEN_254497-1 [Araneus ventricosus]|uniref:Uncharacterized protein n=1 Tax=Araneus ventricosus TaxID=182803 RepID=A0A4Y2W2J1_ARAVE|nr:hypothetical protein AVEN_254497-1 [Araneus ventricosus]
MRYPLQSHTEDHDPRPLNSPLGLESTRMQGKSQTQYPQSTSPVPRSNTKEGAEYLNGTAAEYLPSTPEQHQGGRRVSSQYRRRVPP